MGSLSPGQLEAISVMERVCSVVSLLGCLWTMTTFISVSKFREKPINRLVFYASFGNTMSNVGTLISRSYLDRPDSAGCQIQAMIIQWFMAADAGWIFAMAINVYLTLYRKYDTKRLRRMEIPYLVAIYGITFIPAFVYIFVRRHGNRPYGDAVLWCWIESEFEALRIATFYAPAWLVILLTLFIYIRAGRTIYMTRRQVREFDSDIDLLPEKEPATTHTESLSRQPTIGSAKLRPRPPPNDSLDTVDEDSGPVDDASPSCPGDESVATPDSTSHAPVTDESVHVAMAWEPQYRTPRQTARRRSYEFKSAAYSYTKYSLLYFFGILLIWTPSSANRLYSLSHKNEIQPVLAFMSAFVLPLQGFWNSVIYTVVSWPACLDLYDKLKTQMHRLFLAKFGGRRAEIQPPTAREGWNSIFRGQDEI
ncbi:G-protein coupled receptor [Purpureocillium lavendulum]|uniref:G-protein coupled receptor n=1 Tax=Purpureocillium lavendulum TaxID=1247861 RepID=A0AB34FCS8_9HYPO|nr:G-protein coupled receptor [Purpureocillium lavendulum]